MVMVNKNNFTIYKNRKKFIEPEDKKNKYFKLFI